MRLFTLALVLPICLGIAISCRPDLPAGALPDPPCEVNRISGTSPRNVVLIVSDATRRDRMGIYGGRAKTQRFDRFARGNLYWTNVSSQSPWTKPSIATLFTGLFPSQHRVSTDPGREQRGSVERAAPLAATDALPDELTTLAEAYRDAGFATAAFVGNPWMQREFGFAQGFDVYRDEFARNDTSGRVVSEAALEWLRARGPGDSAYFLYLHYMDAHSPYGRPTRADVLERQREIANDRRPLRREVRGRLGEVVRFEDGTSVVGPEVPANLALLELAYEKGIEAFDAALGLLLDGLETLPDWPETAVLITADHGEALFARGWGEHGHGLFDDEIAVPFAARLPGVATGNPIECQAGLIDVMATLCDYSALSCPSAGFGTSWFGALEKRQRYVVSEGVKGKPRHRSVRNSSYKLIYEPDGKGRFGEGEGYSLYALAHDPEERRDLLAPENFVPELAPIFEILARAVDESVSSFEVPPGAAVSIDEMTRRRLEALGYAE